LKYLLDSNICMATRLFWVLLTTLIVLQFSLAAWGDAARLSSGGAAHQLDGSGTVAMQSEVVKIRVSKHKIRADCTFVL
jgi:hypothetical protein